VVSDPDQYFEDTSNINSLVKNFEKENDLLFDRHCCSNCREIIKAQRRPFKFNGYSNIVPLAESGLKPHQYFLCDHSAEAYVLKQREWSITTLSSFTKHH
jgi:hypothetical protein